MVYLNLKSAFVACAALIAVAGASTGCQMDETAKADWTLFVYNAPNCSTSAKTKHQYFGGIGKFGCFGPFSKDITPIQSLALTIQQQYSMFPLKVTFYEGTHCNGTQVVKTNPGEVGLLAPQFSGSYKDWAKIRTVYVERDILL
ncbi:hypothetical protein BJ138DRAFT_1153355 [Hygrophoropsis aurantiaca]|uniref:Uncharacterized protein n=1 Tax=Hygrophoropsis aurantiaca TaxID=72124 RepID=A0ACB8AB44_9AGAM|nr:hypothetical protein BJ138DRAFT_1153355 [Hygrophoropsis aurantiaca]